MALEVTPSKKLDAVVLGEELRYSLDCTDELGSMTINYHTFTILDSANTDVTSTMGGGTTQAAGIIAFGIKAAVLGTYALRFIVTCNEALPDAVTPYEFYVRLNVTVKDF